MKASYHKHFLPVAPERASVLVVVLWIVFGLVAITLYFAHSMTIELRSSDNRAAGLEAEQAIEGARRYLTCILTNLNSPGAMPDTSAYLTAAVPVGDAHYWLIGRGDQTNTAGTALQFGLIDESSKINLNMSNTTVLSNLLLNLIMSMPSQNLTLAAPDIVANVLAWRSTNTTSTVGAGAQSDFYVSLQTPYTCKGAPFETVDELRMVYGVDMNLLYGEDANLNGILDPNENDADALPPTDNLDGVLNPGLLEYVTVYSQEPTNYLSTNTAAGITNMPRVNIVGVPNPTTISNLLTTNGIAPGRAAQIVAILGPTAITSPLQFFYRGQLTPEEVAQVESSVRGPSVVGLINVNTASAAVLSCVPGLTNGQATELINYRQSNTNNLNGSIAWVLQVLNQQDIAAAGPYLTGHGYQYMADIAALGHNGRGYRRVRFIFDTSQGTSVVLFRQDLSHLGWALGKEVRDKFLLAKITP